MRQNACNSRESHALTRMRKMNRQSILAGAMLALVLPALGWAAPAGASIEQSHQTIPLYSGLLAVSMPQGLQELPYNEMKNAFPGAIVPDYAFSDRLRTLMLAVSLVQSPDPRLDLIAFTMQWGKTLEATLPGFKWIQRRVNRINGRPWITWQYQSETPDGITDNIMFMNILSRDAMIWVNGNAPHAVFQTRMADFEAAVRSIDGTLDVPRLTSVKLTR